MTDMISNCI